jgi:ferritin
MISEKMEKMLNAQIEKEFYASSYYLSIASWVEKKGFEGTANFFYLQAAEEREHGMKIFHFINELDGHAIAPAIDKPPSQFDSYRKIFELSLEQEKANTKAIHEIVDTSLKEKDYNTYNFFEWFIDEQIEEENLFMSILDKLDLIGEQGAALYMLDKELGGRQETQL